jgi:hypothetical protein
MNELSIELKEDRNGFEPGERLEGSVTWSVDQAPQRAELRLFWFTRGKGTEDAGVVQTVQFDRPAPYETRSFEFKLPDAPYSFSGKLISLVWALELVVDPGKQVVRREIEVGPGRREVKLEAVASGPPGQRWLSVSTN